jgi:hypothetical protein
MTGISLHFAMATDFPVSINFGRKLVWAKFWAIFSTNASGHPAPLFSFPTLSYFWRHFLLADFGRFGAILGDFGRFWAILGDFGRY